MYRREIRLLENLSKELESPWAEKDADNIPEIFREYIRRSQKAADIAQRRPNVLLFVGTSIAIIGIIFFVATIPQQSSFANISPEVTRPMMVDELLALTPRILMLLFIQVLAGFFLRQYRASMEEFRYYERVLRFREAQFLSYKLRKESCDQKSLAKFSELLIREDAIGILKGSETTPIIQAQREEKNEFETLIGGIMGSRRKLFGPVQRSKARKSAKD